jgi:hypothetical protein
MRPGLSVVVIREHTVFQHEDDLEHLLNGLLKAGLPAR